MSLGLHLPRTKRFHLFWLVALLFLSQQVALAASLCPVPPSQIMAAASASALQSDCVDGGQAQTHPAMCAQHCAQGSVVQSDTQSPKVPGSLLPPLAPAMPAVLSLPRAESSFAAASRLQPDRPPLRLLFCSLLI